ncbi:type III restriction enzyme [Aphelenchoides avenae]|nr:type III restriction enzyme [Aphelenchus avenae]
MNEPEAEQGDWWPDFLEACSESEENCTVLPYLEPSWEALVAQNRAKRDARRVKPYKHHADVVEELTEPFEPRPNNTAELGKLRLNEYLTDMPAGERMPYTLFPYQNELVAAARQGKNTIICAPTGSGKTIVAVDIMLAHLEEFKEKEKTARIAMFVPTIPLVDQQTMQLLKYMSPDFWITGISGVETLTGGRTRHVLASDVIVFTPQIFVNMLNSVTKENRIYLADFTMLVFDECHYCDAAHPYKIVMDRVRNWKVFREDARRLHIIGMTASPGAGTTLDVDQCTEHLLKLCANMCAATISTVVRQLENLLDKVQPPADEVRRVNRPEKDEFASEIRHVMQAIHANIRPILEGLPDATKESIGLMKNYLDFPPLNQPARYQSHVGALQGLMKRLPSDNAERDLLIRSFEHLSYALTYLVQKMTAFRQREPGAEALLNRFDDVYECLLRHSNAEKTGGARKDILVQLKKILREQYAANPDSRTLIFVATRAAARNLCEYLNSVHEELEFGEKEVGYVTSSNQASVTDGQSNDEQQAMLYRFGSGSGRLKVLVATSVAEEGIDIAECNLIVKYNSVGSERSHTQRRGRARARGSKSILLALDGSVEQKEMENMQKEAMMMVCIRHLQSLGEGLLKRKIAVKSEELRRADEARKLLEAQRQEEFSQREYSLHCLTCNELLSSSVNIRSIGESHYVCVEPEIWQRTRMMAVKKPSIDAIVTTCASLLCAKCSSEVGHVIKYSETFLPSLKADKLQLDRKDTTGEANASVVIAKMTWGKSKQHFFNIGPISEDHMKTMLDAIEDTDKYDFLLEQEALAKQLEVEKKTRKRRQRAYFDDDF